MRVFTKSPTAAIQSILHVLFLPTPFKLLSQTTFVSTSASKSTSAPSASTKTGLPQGPIDASLLDIPEEVLVSGVLYANCAVVVNLPVKLDNSDLQTQVTGEVESGTDSESMDKGKERREVIDIPDDGEYGGELAGRLVWEAYEAGLKVWEAESPRPVEEEGGIGDKKESGSTDMGERTQPGKNEAEVDVYL